MPLVSRGYMRYLWVYMKDVLARLIAQGERLDRASGPLPVVPAEPEAIDHVEQAVAPYVLTEELRDLWSATGGQAFEVDDFVVVPPAQGLEFTIQSRLATDGYRPGPNDERLEDAEFEPEELVYPRCLLTFAASGKWDEYCTELGTEPRATGPVFNYVGVDGLWYPHSSSITEHLSKIADYFDRAPAASHITFDEWEDDRDWDLAIHQPRHYKYSDDYPQTWLDSIGK